MKTNKESVRTLDDYKKQLNKVGKEINKLNVRKASLEKLVDVNPELKEYIELLDRLDTLKQEVDVTRKGDLYETLVSSDQTVISGDYFYAKLTRPYVKETVNFKKFKELFSPRTKAYKECVEETPCKGSVSVKIVE